ncbi:MAG TPA: hypothetical protein VGK59_03160 [Ohtaekwangia sp.]
MKTLTCFAVVRPWTFLFALSWVLLISCSDEDSPSPQNTEPVITDKGTPSGDASSSLIGTSGGTIHSPDGRLTVTIPAGAVSVNTTITIQPITNEGPLGLGSGYRLQPEGLTFAQPVTLTFTYDEQLLDGIPADFLWIITQADDGSWNALTKSLVDNDTKTVSIQTTHFSDWALGKFVDLSLSPASKTILKEQSVELHITGFSRDKALEEDELVPLVPIEGDGEGLTPLTPIPPVESRLMDFRVKQWTLNGAAAPVSGGNGKLSVSKNTATYTAPNKKPSPNPVAVSVELEGNNKEGSKFMFMLTASISVVESNLYLLVKVDGQTYEYYQYGFNGTIAPDPNNLSAANCGEFDGALGIVGTYVQNSTNMIHNFGLQIENPSEGTRSLTCYLDDGNDDMSFGLSNNSLGYQLSYIKRTINKDVCDAESLCGEASVTLIDYSGTPNSRVAGYFSGTLYEEQDGLDDQCKTSIAHPIEGEFWLTRAN